MDHAESTDAATQMGPFIVPTAVFTVAMVAVILLKPSETIVQSIPWTIGFPLVIASLAWLAFGVSHPQPFAGLFAAGLAIIAIAFTALVGFVYDGRVPRTDWIQDLAPRISAIAQAVALLVIVATLAKINEATGAVRDRLASRVLGAWGAGASVYLATMLLIGWDLTRG